MPAISFADSRAYIGVFNNAIHSGQDSTTNARQLQGLLGVSNRPSDLIPGTHASVPNDIYRSLSIEASSDHKEGLGGRVGAGGIGTAMSRHPWATGFVLATTTLTTVAFFAASTSDSLATATHWPADVPQPLPLIMSGGDSSATSETIVGVCEMAISKFPPPYGGQVICPSMTGLHSLKSDAERILQMARGMVRNSAVGRPELERAAECSGVRFRQNKVEALVADLRAEKSRLHAGTGGTSVDMPERVLSTRLQIAEIERKLPVLVETSRHLYDATVILNRKLLQIVG